MRTASLRTATLGSGIACVATGSSGITLVLVRVLLVAALGVLHILGIVGSDVLYHFAVAVYAGDADTRLGKLLLDLHIRAENYAALGDEFGAHILYRLHRIGTQTETHGA